MRRGQTSRGCAPGASTVKLKCLVIPLEGCRGAWGNEGGGGGESAAKCPVDFNDATSEWNWEGAISPFKASTHKDKNPWEEKKKETHLKCNTCVRLLTLLTVKSPPVPPTHAHPPLFIFRHRSGAEKNPSVPQSDAAASQERNCRGSSGRTDGRVLANRLSSADLRP